jgi:hypothetical protein
MYRAKTNTRSLLCRQRLGALTGRTTALRQSTELNVLAATTQRESYGRKTTSLPRSVRAFAVRKFANRSAQRLLTTTRALNNSVTRVANV